MLFCKLATIDYGFTTARRRSGVIAWATDKWALANGSSANTSISLPGSIQDETVAGHLWAKRHGGSEKDERNLVAMDHNRLNNSLMKSQEFRIRAKLIAGKTV